MIARGGVAGRLRSRVPWRVLKRNSEIGFRRPIPWSCPTSEPTAAPCNGAIPPLEYGDRLTRAEFERRYDAMPALKQAELIEGDAILQQGLHSAEHARFVARLERARIT